MERPPFLQDFVNLSSEGLAGGGKCGIIKEKGEGKASRGKGGKGRWVREEFGAMERLDENSSAPERAKAN